MKVNYDNMTEMEAIVLNMDVCIWSNPLQYFNYFR